MQCRACGIAFEAGDGERYTERHPYGESEAEQVMGMLCPNCGSEDVWEEARCEECGEEYAASDISDGLCRVCLEQTRQDLEWCFGTLSKAQQRWAAAHPEWMEM